MVTESEIRDAAAVLDRLAVRAAYAHGFIDPEELEEEWAIRRQEDEATALAVAQAKATNWAIRWEAGL